MRFGAARVAWQSCRAAAGAAINVACAALLAITPPRPGLLLTTARICLQLRRPRRACDAVAGVNIVDVRTAERMTKLAAALCTRGLRAEAKDVLRRATALASHAATPRSALILLLEEDLRAAGGNISSEQWAELEDLLRKSMIESPHLAAPLLALAPENAWAWFEYGTILQNSHHRSDGAFERAADLSGNDNSLLAGVAQHFLYDLDYEKAAKYYERLLKLHPSMWDNFVICRHYATCLQKIARAQEAAQIIATALESCRRAAERAKGEGLELIKREEALLLLQAGRADESFATLQSIQGIAAQVPRYDRVEYLPRTRERLQRLAQIVDARDVFVLLQGPSFATFAARLHEFAGFEFAVATLNSFPPIERELQ